ncbi:MBL fold metallo-hydrolase [Shewanella electrodiphila]|uniref:MBL fold metallo-hydrolase n=1 Tax=Shewanella electrodiphila TaxID=934143 RepID=A0ABT0KQM5_9GAMM|nr:alkyl sulfatase dimerization domain-containing protein [Shewanella electrodiphila]MCL1046152.1 MBL fold metallo-hydrolase [Shewanella electrodiphila]
MFKPLNFYFISLALLLLIGCDSAPINQTDDITRTTKRKHQLVYQQLDINDQEDFNQATKGLIAPLENAFIKSDDGAVIWDTAAYDFIGGKAPHSVNPSLWRQETLNNISGLFEVTKGIYQLRGFDFANMTIIESDNGWIIVDPLTSTETSAAALAFARKHLKSRPIKAIIFTHAHIDHFGGVLGVVTEAEIAQQKITIIAPSGFMEAATSENILAGVAMARRSGFMYGKDLERSAEGHVGSGLGTGPAYGTFTIVQPNDTINETGETRNIDGVEFVFQNAPESESPAELTFYLPQKKAFGGAELVSRNMHNLYTLRGAHVRDALRWSNYINEALLMFGDAEVYFGSHHWPIWQKNKIHEFLEQQRDLYKFTHDQTVRMINQGLNGEEIAEKITLPDSLSKKFYNRGYYGTLSHNAKAVYQFYMGWYDANPANLNPLPTQDSACDYVELIGGHDQIVSKSQAFFDDGNYRFSAELLNKAIFCDEDNQAAINLLAKTYQQLGFQSEAGSWRNAYLSGAKELLDGPTQQQIKLSKMKGLLSNTSVNKFFDTLAIRLDAEKAHELELHIGIHFSDLNEHYLLVVKNGVLRQESQPNLDTLNANVSLTHELFINMLIGQLSAKELLLSDVLEIEGSKLDLLTFLNLFDKPTADFNIVTP